MPVKPDAPQGLLGKKTVANVSAENKLVAMHNLSAQNLRHAERMGGLPVPSVAISKVSSPLDGFGDISLIADSAMVTPGRKNPVFSADAYSQGYPSVEYKVTGSALKQLNDALKKYGAGERHIYGDEIRRVDDLVSVPAFKKYASDVLGKDADFSQRKELSEGLLSKVGAEERIFKGYTYSGNRRYSPHTLENVVKEMTGDPRGGESFNYGINSLRAQVTPKFTSLSGIQKARDRITTKEATEAAKVGATNDLFTLAEKFRPYGGGGNEFDFLNSFTQNLGDWARGRVRLEEFYPDVPQELKSEALQMLGRLRNAPVGYFEAKPQRAVGIGEFEVDHKQKEEVVMKMKNVFVALIPVFLPTTIPAADGIREENRLRDIL